VPQSRGSRGGKARKKRGETEKGERGKTPAPDGKGGEKSASATNQPYTIVSRRRKKRNWSKQ